MLVAILFLLAVIIGFIIFIPPFHWSVILILIFLVTITNYLALKIFHTSKKYSLLISLLIFTLLSLLALDLFEPVNVTLAISLFVGILILLK